MCRWEPHLGTYLNTSGILLCFCAVESLIWRSHKQLVATQSPFYLWVEGGLRLYLLKKVQSCPDIHYYDSNAHLQRYPPNIVQQNIPQGELIPHEKPRHIKKYRNPSTCLKFPQMQKARSNGINFRSFMTFPGIDVDVQSRLKGRG